MTSPRRFKQVRLLSLFTFFLSFSWFLLSRHLEQYELANWTLASAIGFIVVYVLVRMNQFTPARILYILSLNIGVVTSASYVGQPGNVEFILLFAMGLPFLMFSFRKEMALVVICSLLPLTEWVLLFVTDFNLITTSKVAVDTASKIYYPFSLITTFVLVGFQTSYFAILNAGYYNRVHDQRREAEEASTAKSTFLSTMSHEIRTPLNAIIGLSHILRDGNPREDQKENIEALNFSGKLLLDLLNDVLDYSKMEAREFEIDPVQTDLNEIFHQLHKIHQPNCSKKGIALNMEVDQELPNVWLDAVRFNQVVNNLINNAVKFTERGSVTLKVQHELLDGNQTKLHVQVIDTGIGIANERKDDIFEAFKQEDSSTQRVYGGTGLGLSIVKEIVEHMDGEIVLESELGKGSNFGFVITLNRVSSLEEEAKMKQVSHRLDGLRVLLVEDNPINEMVGRQILEKEGMIVDSAFDGSEAVQKARETQYDIILMDIQMPVMDGYEASRTIRLFDSEIPIVALSASVFMEVKDKIHQAGMDGFVFKPFDPNKLFEEISMKVVREVA